MFGMICNVFRGSPSARTGYTVAESGGCIRLRRRVLISTGEAGEARHVL